ncbi:hypothetical protein RJT34_09096 [Clitoria ternatea]|uniref:Uncharacterized protein n=1 Tax=Clitoria ternatea TaxID=43366 RepID=A0AAN9K8H4_CLITE
MIEPTVNDALGQLGHAPGRSRFNIENHNSCFQRACVLSAATKLIFQAMSTKALLRRLVNIKGTHSNLSEPRLTRAYPTMSIFLSFMDTIEYSTFLFCDYVHDDNFLEGVQPPPRNGYHGNDIGHQVWNFNGEGRMVFMSRLGPFAKAEEETLVDYEGTWRDIMINPMRFQVEEDINQKKERDDEEVGEASTPPNP